MRPSTSRDAASRPCWPTRIATEYAAHLRDFRPREPVRILGTAREVHGRRGDGSSFPIELTLTEADLR